MDGYVARQNIERFRQQLGKARDEGERRIIQQLLEREETRLARISTREEPS